MNDKLDNESALTRLDAHVLLFKPDTRALARLSISTSVVIATLLTIPDAIGIIPASTNVGSWILRLVGLWITTSVLWFVSFLFILYLVRVIVGGVRISDKGIKLWRFAKTLKWTQVDAVSVEPQFFFSKLFGLDDVARRLTIFEHKKARDGKTRLLPHYLPSFFFLHKEFERMCETIFDRRFKFIPTSVDAFLAETENLPTLQSTFGTLRWQRVALSLLISLGLSMWLYKKAVAMYAYNSGNIAMTQMDYKQARKLYTWALETDPMFAPAWNNRGNAEFRLALASEATKDWERSIAVKPDFVEPRISLSYIALTRGDWEKAKDFIDSALNLNPLNEYALLNRADLEMTLGHVRSSMQDARMVISQEQNNSGSLSATATCLLARGKVRTGEARDAERLLHALGPIDLANQQSNIRLRLTVSGEAALALGKLNDARNFFSLALKLYPNNVEAIVGLASVHLLTNDLTVAQNEIARAIQMVPESPCPRLLQARLDLMRGDTQSSEKAVSKILLARNLDGSSLVEAGNLLFTLHHLDQAAFCAQRALRIDAEDRGAKQLLACVLAEQKTVKP